MFTDADLDIFFQEVSGWSINIINQDNFVPRCLVGIKDNGQKFAFVLNGLPLESNDWHDFIKTVLAEENCFVYGYSTLMGAYIEETNSVREELHVGVATKEKAIFGNWDIDRDREGGPIHLGEPHIYPNQKPERSPMTWDIVITEISENERAKYLTLWNSIRDKAHWMN